MKNGIIWNGCSDLANRIFGDGYTVDWEYVSRESLDIIVKGRIIKLNETI